MKDNDRFLGANPKTSTRFDRNFSITDYLRINVGAELGLPLVSASGLYRRKKSFFARKRWALGMMNQTARYTLFMPLLARDTLRILRDIKFVSDIRAKDRPSRSGHTVVGGFAGGLGASLHRCPPVSTSWLDTYSETCIALRTPTAQCVILGRHSNCVCVANITSIRRV